MMNDDTIVALSTPEGIGAIAMIRLSGSSAIDLIGKVFKGKKLTDVPSHTLHHGWIEDGDEMIDEVMIGIFRAPNSYTKENVVEISTHGSSFIAQKIIRLLIRKGARA